jgi:hypothetical protein
MRSMVGVPLAGTLGGGGTVVASDSPYLYTHSNERSVSSSVSCGQGLIR